jgi:hypothetical protein
MWKPTTLLFLLACLAAIGALVFTLTRPTEPSYKGHNLSYWLQIADSNDEAVAAINAIGTNAIPVLLRWMTYEPPRWRKSLAKVAYKFKQDDKMFDYLFGTERHKAMLGFALLGTNAASALPALVTLMKDTTNPPRAAVATHALAYLGQPALPYLTDALSDPNATRRATVVIAISAMAFHGASTNDCLTPLLKATTDADPAVRHTAWNAIVHIAPQVLTNTPPP